ncbi:MAG TPA: hypothetical protein VHO25_04885 [Polyangiaceae bacterium]|nr:hypothetical protein [Polyangiaceae bacterium]
MRNAIIVAGVFIFTVGCEEAKKPEAAPAPVAAPVIASAAVKAAEPAPSAAVDPVKAAQAEAQKAVEENPLTPCCRALGRIGFNERSQEYTAAAQDCGKGMEANKTLAQVAADLKKALKGKSLPDECVAK